MDFKEKKRLKFVSIWFACTRHFPCVFPFTVCNTLGSSMFNYYPNFTDKKLKAQRD